MGMIRSRQMLGRFKILAATAIVITGVAGMWACELEAPPSMPGVSSPTGAPATPAPAPTPAATPTTSPSPTPTATAMPAPTPTTMPTPTATPTAAPTPTATRPPTPMPTGTPSADPPGREGSQSLGFGPGGPSFPCGPQNRFFQFDFGGFVKWTPSGSHILFDDRSTILSVDAGGSRLRTVVDANPGERFVLGLYADISPDGARVAYTSCQYMTEGKGYHNYSGDRGKYMHEIAMVAMDGSAPDRLTDSPFFSEDWPNLRPVNHYPAWSPDGKRIAFRVLSWFASWFGNSYVTIMSADGSNQSDRIGPASPGVYTPQVWSPDGQSLAFVDNRGDRMLYTVRPDGTELSAVSEALGHVSWSPDSQRLALARQEGDDVVLITIAADGSDPQTVAKNSQ